MALRLNGSSSGYVELDVPAAAGSHTLTLPDGGGSSGQYLQTDGSGGLSWQTVTIPTSAFTFLNPASLVGASSATITGIPPTATMVIVGWEGASDTGGNSLRVRLGTNSGIVLTNYETSDGYLGGAANNGVYTRSDAYDFGAAGMGVTTYDGRITFTRLGNNQIWYGEGSERQSGATTAKFYTIGSVYLAGALERAQLLIPSGSFDSGTMYVYYI